MSKSFTYRQIVQVSGAITQGEHRGTGGLPSKGGLPSSPTDDIMGYRRGAAGGSAKFPSVEGWRGAPGWFGKIPLSGGVPRSGGWFDRIPSVEGWRGAPGGSTKFPSVEGWRGAAGWFSRAAGATRGLRRGRRLSSSGWYRRPCRAAPRAASSRA